eukprot:CAMPEP_0115256522 /NCGR_PEP_ID=MMETSP0270-20121206/46292_1 /TAXON_ID=71861 /ORGANISM="Scrippsiella trochoidea, Strain CCMP3099" /LENGTH=135 /DNA_ID=CAMNT_0002672183 /DNA_START=362 /DNA_END=770 /DNA_ORIENTATION=+
MISWMAWLVYLVANTKMEHVTVTAAPSATSCSRTPSPSVHRLPGRGCYVPIHVPTSPTLARARVSNLVATAPPASASAPRLSAGLAAHVPRSSGGEAQARGQGPVRLVPRAVACGMAAVALPSVAHHEIHTNLQG